MRVDVVLRYVGVVMLFIATFMLLSAGISYLSGVDSAFYPLLLSSLLTALLGAFPLIFVGKREQITNKEGFCIVVGAWLVACVVSMFPYLIWGGEFSLVNAWFESVSGFTTTGSTILNDVEALPRGLQFCRFSTTLVGGMGVVMFALVVLPSMGRSKMMLSNVELSTMAKDNYRYRSQIIVQILLVVYVGLTILSTVMLKMAGMNWFDALCHAMSACATSGFSTKNASIAYFNSPAIDTILIFAMATAGVQGRYSACAGVLSAIRAASSAPRCALRLMTEIFAAPASAHSTPMARAAPPAPRSVTCFPSSVPPFFRRAATKPLPSLFSPIQRPPRQTTVLTAPMMDADTPISSSSGRIWILCGMVRFAPRKPMA